MRKYLLATTTAVGLVLVSASAFADMAAADKFLKNEVAGLSAISAAEQKA